MGIIIMIIIYRDAYSDSAEYYIKQTVKWCNNPVKTRTEDENTTRAADSVCRRRKNEFAPSDGDESSEDDEKHNVVV